MSADESPPPLPPPPPPAPALLACTVAGCRRPLERDATERALRCGAGHSFDRARSGYWNLLQPQDRRSLRAGDPVAVAAARRRLHERGHDEALLAALERLLTERRPDGGRGSAPLVWVDIGCGDGSILGALAASGGVVGAGIDLSAPSIERAARRFPRCGVDWVVANADRGLPVLDGACDVVSSIAGRLPVEAMARALRPAAGRAVVAVAGPRDLEELRAETHGHHRADTVDRAAAAAERLASQFDLEFRETIRTRLRLDAQGLDDLLLASYRAGRAGRRDRARAAATEGVFEVTIERVMLVLRLRPGVVQIP